MRELVLSLVLIGLVGSMIVPLPAAVMDLLIVLNFLGAVALFVAVVYSRDALKLNGLPGLLLLATLFRLACNVSSTRLILGHGSAGEVIEAFGRVVVQGNIVVGLVIFLVITAIQFIVIAKGAERVAEVCARFTLDALPGKQISIDSDVRSGALDLESARQKRQDLQVESRFYGALDGAMKFIRGDAIAGLLIAAINIIGGFFAGVVLHGLSVKAAAVRYTLLSVGDGLVSQLPALLNSLTAGMVVTRVSRGRGESMAAELLAPLRDSTQASLVVAAVCAVMAALPGMPSVVLVVIAISVCLSELLRSRTKPAVASVSAFQPEVVPLVELRLSQGFDPESRLRQLIEESREHAFTEHGILLPYIPLAMPRDAAKRRATDSRAELRVRGRVVASESHVTAEATVKMVQSFIAANLSEFIDDQMTRRLLDHHEATCGELLAAVIPAIASVTQITLLLRALVEDRIPPRPFELIMQAVAENKGFSQRRLLEEVRVALRHQISQVVAPTGKIRAATLDPSCEMLLVVAERSDQPLDPGVAHVIATHLASYLSRDPASVVVTAKPARALVVEILLARGMRARVVAFEELAPEVSVEVVHVVPAPGGIEGAAHLLIAGEECA